jgi:FtsP/CotA-like multicopper oxidase with cupredoxin domain
MRGKWLFTGMALIACVLLLAAVPAGAQLTLQCPGDNNNDGDNTDPGETSGIPKCMTLTGGDGFSTMADGRVLYMFSFGDLTGTPATDVMSDGMLAAEWPAPTIEIAEGEEFYLTLANVGMVVRPDLFDPHTVHWHGFPEASTIFDGVPDASISINMGSALTYYYSAPGPGTYMYHCHVEATEHMQMGMLGNLYVTPNQDGETVGGYNTFAYNDNDGTTGYDVHYPIQIGSFDGDFHDASELVQPLPFALMWDDYPMLNGRGYPDTINPSSLGVPDHELAVADSQPVNSLITAAQGQRILLRISNLNVTRFYTLASLGMPMQIVGQDAKHLTSVNPAVGHMYFKTNSVEIGGGSAVDVLLDTSEVEQGTYFLYTTNLNYLSNNDEDYGGMMTEIVVGPPLP